jgi:host factor-I protein
MRPGFGERNERTTSINRVTPPSSSEQARRKPVPPERTHAEEYYYVKQMSGKTPMCVVLDGNEILHGWIEWYDETCIKLNRTDGPNLLIYKSHIRYLYKDAETAPGE